MTRGQQQPRPAVVPYLADKGAREAIDWYGAVCGAVVEGEPYENDDGTIGQVAVRIADAVVYLADAVVYLADGVVDLADEAPEHGAVAPTGPGAAVGLMLPVRDIEVTLAEVVREGATADDRGAYEGHGSRNAWFVDPFGHRWGISSPEVSP